MLHINNNNKCIITKYSILRVRCRSVFSFARRKNGRTVNAVGPATCPANVRRKITEPPSRIQPRLCRRRRSRRRRHRHRVPSVRWPAVVSLRRRRTPTAESCLPDSGPARSDVVVRCQFVTDVLKRCSTRSGNRADPHSPKTPTSECEI